MIIGVPKEIKNRECRVALVPGGAKTLVGAGHKLIVEKGAGQNAGISDERYIEAGAKIVSSANEVWSQAEMIMKVKEPIAAEFERMKEGQILYTYLHLAAATDLARELVKRKVNSIAYETIELADRSLPLLTPMSEVAGRMSVQIGAQCLQRHSGGKGQLLGGVPGVRRGRVAIIGGGVVGINAAKMAIGLGARVTILDVSAQRLAYLDDVFGSDIDTLMSNPENIERAVIESDLVIGAVLIAGAKAPKLVTRKLVSKMEAGSAIVDVAIDQGGCIETIRATTHDEPVFVEEGVIHYGVTNIPGDVPMTSTYALTNVTLGYALKVANLGFMGAIERFPELRKGVNTYNGKIVHSAVAEAMGIPCQSL